MFPLKIVIFHSYVSLPEGTFPCDNRNQSNMAGKSKKKTGLTMDN